MTSQELIDKLNERFREKVLEAEEKAPGKIFVGITHDAIKSISDYLFNELGGRYVMGSGIDKRKINGKFGVLHVFAFDKDKIYISIKADLPGEEVDSITPQVPAASWAEREIQDLFGIKMRGHPDPRKLILPDDWPDGIHPLRKDVSYNIKPPSYPSKKMPRKEPEDPNISIVPIGPFFPVLEEPSYWRVFVDGEKVVGCDYRGFYAHRGIEKLGESVLTYNQIPMICQRICGICGMVHAVVYCQAVEEAAGIEAPERAKFIRTIILELERIHSHILWFGIAAHILGFDTVLMQTWRIREPVMWLCERITGNRKAYDITLVGGVRRDIPKDRHGDVLEVLKNIEKEWKDIIRAVEGDTPLMLRLKGVGILSHENAKKLSPVGPTVRGSGVPVDIRIDHPYAAYDKIDVKVISFDLCDNLARVLVRLLETLESIKQVRQCLEEMPEGPIMADIKEPIPAGKEGMSGLEAPRGEVFHYVITGDTNRPFRWKVRAPSYMNVPSVPVMLIGEALADVPIILGSVDPCFACTERLEVVDAKTGKVLRREKR